MSAISDAVGNPFQASLSEETVGLETKLVDFASDKTKVFFEALANISFYFSKMPYPNADKWSACEKQFGMIKTAMSVPSFFRGSFAFFQNYADGKLTFKKGYSDLAFVVSDGVDVIKTLQNFEVIVVADALKAAMDKIKTLAGLIGITKSIDDCYAEILKLKQMELSLVSAADEKKQSKAVEIKRRWVASELRSKEYDMLKNISGYALCVLSMTVGFIPWEFAILGSVGLVGKFMNYYHKVDASFWQNKFITVSS